MREEAGRAGPEGVSKTVVEVRSYELDSFGHANHAVFLNWFEHARFQALEAGGYDMEGLAERGWAVVVVRAEVDYRREALLNDRIRIRTGVGEVRRSSMVLEQEAVRVGSSEDDEEELLAEARIVAVWLEGGRPRRVPDEVLEALGAERASR